jgi:hypothetical protein
MLATRQWSGGARTLRSEAEAHTSSPLLPPPFPASAPFGPTTYHPPCLVPHPCVRPGNAIPCPHELLGLKNTTTTARVPMRCTKGGRGEGGGCCINTHVQHVDMTSTTAMQGWRQGYHERLCNDACWRSGGRLPSRALNFQWPSRLRLFCKTCHITAIATANGGIGPPHKAVGPHQRGLFHSSTKVGRSDSKSPWWDWRQRELAMPR